MDGQVGGLVAGQILCGQWGYSMQLVNFYEVVKGAQVGKFAVLQKLGNINVSTDAYGQAGKQVADPLVKVDPPFKKKVLLGYQGEVNVKITSCQWAKPWDGQPKAFDTYD